MPNQNPAPTARVPGPLEVPIPRHLLPEVSPAPLRVDITGMRVHELALQGWLYNTFFVQAGYPIPVVFATPMDAFSEFLQLWAQEGEGNPFRYLLDLKDPAGNALYEPYPANPRYPLISVTRKGWSNRVTQNYGIHKFRYLRMPTVDGNNLSNKGCVGTITRRELHSYVQTQMPSAWDFRFQIDHQCMRPDTQAYFVEQAMRAFKHTGGQPQCWVKTVYPGFFGEHNGQGYHLLRMYLSGDIDDATEYEPQDGPLVFRTSMSVTLEGYSVDLDYELVPAFWSIFFSTRPASPEEIANVQKGEPYTGDEVNEGGDLRSVENNARFNSETNMPIKSGEPPEQPE